MDENVKKPALRLVPYGMFVLTTRSQNGEDKGVSTINWLTQCSFKPPLIAIGVKADSKASRHIRDTGVYAINVIGTNQKDMAFAFFKPQSAEGGKIGGFDFEDGEMTRCPLILACPAWWECKVIDEISKGDHTLFIGEVVQAGVRSDEKAIFMRDHNLYYAG